MIYPRLGLLRQFLRDDGVIFVSLDDNEIQNLRAVMDEVFGAANFLATIIWQKRTSPDARLHLGPAHDYVVAYARNLPALKPTLNKIGLSGERIKAFKNPDNDVRGPWASVDMTGQTGHATPDQFYEIVTPKGKPFKPPQGRCWAMAKKTVDSLIGDNRIWFGKTGGSRPRLKKFLSETEGMTSWTWWPNAEVGHNQEGTKELNEIMQKADLFENPKPTRLIKRILELATSKDSLVLDSFAGSGTTGDTILQLNKQDGGSRRCILVEMESKISREITAERVKRVAQGYTNAKGEKVEGLGGGFRFCELGEPIYDEIGRLRPEVKFADLARHVYFFETGESLPRERVHTTPLLGAHLNRAVCLLYNGILRDKSPEGGNALTHATLALLREECSGRGIERIVVYGTSRRLSPARLAREGVTFKQIPYTLRTT
jgi:site-specific DNA-methyltransferase (adenine-specific)/adenine-specific DNA-methyltransferase